MTAHKLRLITAAIEKGKHDMDVARTDWRNAILKGEPITGDSAIILETMSRLTLPSDMSALFSDLKSLIQMPGLSKCRPQSARRVAV